MGGVRLRSDPKLRIRWHGRARSNRSGWHAFDCELNNWRERNNNNTRSHLVGDCPEIRVFSVRFRRNGIHPLFWAFAIATPTLNMKGRKLNPPPPHPSVVQSRRQGSHVVVIIMHIVYLKYKRNVFERYNNNGINVNLVHDEAPPELYSKYL